MSEAFAIAEALGVRIVTMPDLGRDAHYIPDALVLVVDADLAVDRRGRVMDELLPLIFAEEDQ